MKSGRSRADLLRCGGCGFCFISFNENSIDNKPKIPCRVSSVFWLLWRKDEDNGGSCVPRPVLCLCSVKWIIWMPKHSALSWSSQWLPSWSDCLTEPSLSSSSLWYSLLPMSSYTSINFHRFCSIESSVTSLSLTWLLRVLNPPPNLSDGWQLMFLLTGLLAYAILSKWITLLTEMGCHHMVELQPTEPARPTAQAPRPVHYHGEISWSCGANWANGDFGSKGGTE